MVGFVLRSIAKFSQRCSVCGKRIYVGTRIERHGKRWRHALCITTAPCISSERVGNTVYTPRSRQVCSESPGSLWLMAQGTAPASLVSVGQLLGRGVTEEHGAEYVAVLKLFERVRCVSYDDRRIVSGKRRRWRRGALCRVV